jgi:hypothetical protein
MAQLCCKASSKLTRPTLAAKRRISTPNKKLHAGRGRNTKTAVIGMRERSSGRVKAMTLPFVNAVSLQASVTDNVGLGSEIQTDEHPGYIGLEDTYYHDTVNHAGGEYGRPGVSTNSIESVWAVLKRGLHGVYHHASPKHLDRYVQEFAFRLNDGNVKRHTLDRLDSFIAASSGMRLTYERLIA